MQVPVDDNGLEWWEKLPIEKQDRVPLPPPTAEAIEDIHWQLVVELDEKSLEAALKGDGKLPGSDCSCKACKVHQSELPMLFPHDLCFPHSVIEPCLRIVACCQCMLTGRPSQE